MMREDWVNTELGICCNIKMGQSPPSTTYNTDEKGLPFFQGKAEFTKIHPIVRKWCSTPKQIADDNDILLSVRAPVGATNIANQKCAIGRGLAAIKYHHCHKYIFYYLNLIEKRLDGLGTGTTFKAISGGILRSQIIPLAPLPEQRAIVAKIEQLLSDLDNGIANLRTAKGKLEIYRQAVLKKAFEGELTKEWRDINLQKIEDWQKKFLADVSDKITDGEHFRPKTQESGIYFLSAKDIRENGVDFSSPLYISEETANKALKRCNPERNDILIVSRGATVGRMCIVNTDNVFCLLGSVILIKVNESMNSRYLTYVLQSPTVNQNLITLSGSTAQQAIYLRDIKKVEITIPTFQEQAQIVQEIETRLSVCDKLSESLDQSLKKSEALRQSILKKAFEGKLLSESELEACRQEYDWEPADKLLERIKKEKVKSSNITV